MSPPEPRGVFLYQSSQRWRGLHGGGTEGGWGRGTYRRRINTKEKAKVVAAVRGTEFIKFLAALVILHPIIQIVLVYNS